MLIPRFFLTTLPAFTPFLKQILQLPRFVFPFVRLTDAFHGQVFRTAGHVPVPALSRQSLILSRPLCL